LTGPEKIDLHQVGPAVEHLLLFLEIPPAALAGILLAGLRNSMTVMTSPPRAAWISR